MNGFYSEFSYQISKNKYAMLIPALHDLQKAGILTQERSESLLHQYEQIREKFDKLMITYEETVIEVIPESADSYTLPEHYFKLPGCHCYRRRSIGPQLKAQQPPSGRYKVYAKKARRNSNPPRKGKKTKKVVVRRATRKLSKKNQEELKRKFNIVLTVIRLLFALNSDIQQNEQIEKYEEIMYQQSQTIDELSEAIDQLNETLREMIEKTE